MNQREIKFRNCSHIDKKCYEPFTIKDMFLHAKGGSIIAEDNELCQFTGLKDKNGKKMFEGDIVRYNFDLDNPEIMEVIFNPPKFEFKRPKPNKEKVIFVSMFGNGLMEVIGNIYENPELLTNK